MGITRLHPDGRVKILAEWTYSRYTAADTFSAVRTVGIFWMNAAETWVDISSSNARKVS